MFKRKKKKEDCSSPIPNHQQDAAGLFGEEKKRKEAKEDEKGTFWAVKGGFLFLALPRGERKKRKMGLRGTRHVMRGGAPLPPAFTSLFSPKKKEKARLEGRKKEM